MILGCFYLLKAGMAGDMEKNTGMEAEKEGKHVGNVTKE